jgi:hypothetical protein
MKTKRVILINVCLTFFLLLLSACEEKEVERSIASELSPYIEQFYNEAAERNVSLPTGLVAIIEQGQSAVTTDQSGDQYTIKYSPTIFARQNDLQRQAMINFTLGKLMLKRNNVSDDKNAEQYSFMNIMLGDNWDVNDSETLYNELFSL